MKVKVLQSELAKGLSIVGKAVAERATLPVLAHVLLNAEDGRLKLAATDLAIGISTVVGGQIIEEGGVTLPAKTLTVSAVFLAWLTVPGTSSSAPIAFFMSAGRSSPFE